MRGGRVNLEETRKWVESAATTLLMVVLSALGVRVFFQTLPLLHAEAENISLVTVQNGAKTRMMLDQINRKLPEEQQKAGVVLDDTHQVLTDTDTTIRSINTLVKNLDKNQNELSGNAVIALNALKDGLTATAGSVKEIGDQTVKTEQAVASTADAATQTAKAATGTADASTKTAEAATTLVKDVHDPTVKAAQTFSDTVTEGQQFVHKLLHPRWPSVVFGEIKDFSAKVLGAWL